MYVKRLTFSASVFGEDNCRLAKGDTAAVTAADGLPLA
jgi:hypothetical protein